MAALKKIPYGISSYKRIRQEDCYYVDKTRFIPKLEAAGDFLFLIRPRRFGKSSLLTLLESYYDIARKEEFDFLFKNTFIGRHPTVEKNALMILKFNFSQVSPQPEKTEESFNEHADDCFFFFAEKYRDHLGDDFHQMMARKKSAHGKLGFLLSYIGSKGLKVYVLIDEYDNFTNTILATAGQATYHELTHGAGFLRFFFNILKGAVDQVDTGVQRMFITGVSPVTMDDVTSGFNIGRNISLESEFNELLGFTQQDVIELSDYYGIGSSHANELIHLMGEWYGNYRFSGKASGALYNTDMILYFVQHFIKTHAPPDNMIDRNVRVDYDKLRHLVVLDQRLNGNFSHLFEIIQTHSTRAANVVEGFPVERLTKPSNFISLLFYFGLLSYTSKGELQIPNQTVKQLMYGYIREGYEDVDLFSVDLWRFADLIRNMAYRGEWEPVFRFLADQVKKQTAIRDYLTGEKVVQTFVLAYLNVVDLFITHAEEEMGMGHADLYLEPFRTKYPDIRYSYLIEIKYLPRSRFSEQRQQQKRREAQTQLLQYASDVSVAKRCDGTELKGVVLVFAGWELKSAVEFDLG